jgi:hypothetical protein
MFDPQMQLLSTVLAAVVQDPTSDAAWQAARAARAACQVDDADLVLALETRDAAALGAILEQWTSGKRLFPEHDREVLKRALKAFRKSLKVTRLDAESSLGVGPMSSGRHSGIVGMRPPDRYPPAVWEELARQGRLIAGKFGVYELPPE